MVMWRVEFLAHGGPGPLQFPGWYALRTWPNDPGFGLRTSYLGPFTDEAEAAQWVHQRNVSP